MYDIVIVGAGPAGLSAALMAKERNLNYLLLEQSRLANTIFNYPKNKHILAKYNNPKRLKGLLWFKNTTREDLLEKWREIVKENKIKIKIETANDIKKSKNFKIFTNKNVYEAKNVVVAVGIQVSPKKLGVKGENNSNVIYHLNDIDKYKDKNILVVGGGNIAAEIAVQLCKKNNVTMSYRRPKFFRIDEYRLNQINEEVRNNNLKILFNSNIKEINKKKTILSVNGNLKDIKTDYVFLCLGFNLPTDFLKKLNVKIKNGRIVLNRKLESSIKGLYFIGDITGEPQIIGAINQGYEVIKNIS